MPDNLRWGLWNACKIVYFEEIGDFVDFDKNFKAVCNNIWFSFLREPLDGIPSDPERALRELRNHFEFLEFYRVYDFIEMIPATFPSGMGTSKDKEQKARDFYKLCNHVLTRERAAFRFAEGQLVQVSDEVSLEAVRDTLSESSPAAVRRHISTAARYYSKSPVDYRNSIKESISAVESAIFCITGEKHGRLREPLRTISEKYGIHPSLTLGIEKIFAYTSDKEGVRHAMMDVKEISQNEARFMLVSCSALSNYLLGLDANE